MSSGHTGSGFGSFLTTFVIGAAAGAAVALLTTPRTGREMRARFKGAARDVGDSMQHLTGAVQNAGAKAAKVGQAAYEQVKDGARHTYNMAADASLNTPPRFNK